MTAALLLLAGCGVAGYYLACARHLERSAKPTTCRHQRLRVMDGEVDSCWSCGQPMPRKKGTAA